MTKEKLLRVGVILGGRSGEHAVSLMSARFVLSVLDPQKYQVTQIGITRQGVWLVGEDVLSALTREEFDSLSPATILSDPTRPGLKALTPQADGDLLKAFADLDVVFPVLHGTFGEDGTLQGLLEMAGVAYVGAGVLGSSTAMDKALFFDVMRANHIPVVETVLILASELKGNPDAALSRAETVGAYPLFVKPANLGSSVGVSKVQNRSDLLEGLMEAAKYGRRVIVQKGLDVREIEVSVIGNENPEASVCGEIVPAGEFYSYDAKYHDDRSKAHIPAELPNETSEKIRAIAIKAYKALDVAGMARVDFFVERETGEVYLNELNTIPGFTQISMYPMLWEASGLSNQALVDRLIELALERRLDREATQHEFRRAG
ncbi:MAG: D-alanine--D-alanine ligase [Chloroflexi bacterium]|nr:D-alanine--D-alanine ligase [Chloroflexota bacterium]MQC26524.1 D-alanine--D-alanine ligase [Chloroflexota bacterium]